MRDAESEPEFEPVELGLAPSVSDAVGEALVVDDRLLELLGVCAGVGVPLTVASAVGVGEALNEEEVESVPEFDPVELGLAPSERLAVGDAVIVTDELIVPLAVIDGVAVPLTVAVGLTVLDMTVGSGVTVLVGVAVALPLTVDVSETDGEFVAVTDGEPDTDGDELKEFVLVLDGEELLVRVGEGVKEDVGVLEKLGIDDVLLVRDGSAPTEEETDFVMVTVADGVPESDPVPVGEELAVGVSDVVAVCVGVSDGVELASREFVDDTDALAFTEREGVSEADSDDDKEAVVEGETEGVPVAEGVDAPEGEGVGVCVCEKLFELESEEVLDGDKKRGRVTVAELVLVAFEVLDGEAVPVLVAEGVAVGVGVGELLGLELPEILAEPVSELVREGDTPTDRDDVGDAVSVLESEAVDDGVTEGVPEGDCVGDLVAVIDTVEVAVSGDRVCEGVGVPVGVFVAVAVDVVSDVDEYRAELVDASDSLADMDSV